MYITFEMIAVICVIWIIVKVFAYKFIVADVIRAAIDRDPAATGQMAVIFTYSGARAVFYYRIARQFYKLNLHLIARLLSQWARWMTGIEIHPGAEIGKGIFIDHGMGVVIGETAVIGDNATLFQGVTLGGTGKEKGKRHPTLGHNVVVGAGAKVLGNITIGENVSIGANSVVLRDVPPNSTVVGVPGHIAKREGKRIQGVNIDYTSLPDPVQQALEKLQHEIDKIEKELEEDHKK
jgi:serine O-acetyltransferase